MAMARRMTGSGASFSWSAHPIRSQSRFGLGSPSAFPETTGSAQTSWSRLSGAQPAPVGSRNRGLLWAFFANLTFLPALRGSPYFRAVLGSWYKELWLNSPVLQLAIRLYP